MAYRKAKTILNRRVDKTGYANYDDVYSIINDNVDQISEFYELEPAIVTKVYVNPNDPDFPTVDNSNNENVTDYSYFGSIKATFIYSQNKGDEIAEYIKPLSSHITVYPTKGEVVNVAKHGGQYYYYFPLNLRNSVNMNRVAGEAGEGEVLEQRTKYNRGILGEQGDIVLNGRFGQAIKFGSDKLFINPDIKITNKQFLDKNKKDNDNFPHFQNINDDGSSIFITSGLTQKPGEVLFPAAPSKTWPPNIGNIMNGNMVTINSDKLVFNAKGDGTINKSNGDIHMLANRNINLSSRTSVNIEVEGDGTINLGDPDSQNPAVKGKELTELLVPLFSTLKQFANKISSNDVGPLQISKAASEFKKDMENLEPKILSVLSDKVRIANDKSVTVDSEAGEIYYEPDSTTNSYT